MSGPISSVSGHQLRVFSHVHVHEPVRWQALPRRLRSKPEPFPGHNLMRLRPICQAQSEGLEAESSEAPSNSLFNAQFSAVLQGALERQGQDALMGGEAKYEEPKPSAAEEVLLAALQDARRQLAQLENIISALTKQQEREQKQFERIHFAYKRAKGDAAYIRSCEKRLEKAMQSQ